MTREQPPTETIGKYASVDIVQGGMGVGVSDHGLAAAVAAEGAMGVVSGTVIGPVLARRLQNGDPDGAMRLALGAFPDQATAEEIIQTTTWTAAEPLTSRINGCRCLAQKTLKKPSS